jgi:hypothetical protein
MRIPTHLINRSLGFLGNRQELSFNAPQVQAHRQFDFYPRDADGAEVPPPPSASAAPSAGAPAGAGTPPAADAPRPEAEAIREVLQFVTMASQKHPDLFLAADNPVLEVFPHFPCFAPFLSFFCICANNV